MAGPESWLRPTLTACLPRDDRTRPWCDLRHLREPPGGQFLERLITRTALVCDLHPGRSAQRFERDTGPHSALAEPGSQPWRAHRTRRVLPPTPSFHPSLRTIQGYLDDGAL